MKIGGIPWGRVGDSADAGSMISGYDECISKWQISHINIVITYSNYDASTTNKSKRSNRIYVI